MRHLRNYFISGLITVLPIAATLWILAKLFEILDSILGKPLSDVLGFNIPGLGLIVGLLLVLTIGIVVSNVVGKKISHIVHTVFERMPILKTIYSPLKDMMNNFSNEQSNNFKRAILVPFPNCDCRSIGFITKEHVVVDGGVKTVAFVPTTPNPTSGFLMYLDKGDYSELDIPIEVALKSIISLGSVSPDHISLK